MGIESRFNPHNHPKSLGSNDLTDITEDSARTPVLTLESNRNGFP
jgi:hypothetical protein